MGRCPGQPRLTGGKRQEPARWGSGRRRTHSWASSGIACCPGNAEHCSNTTVSSGNWKSQSPSGVVVPSLPSGIQEGPARPQNGNVGDRGSTFVRMVDGGGRQSNIGRMGAVLGLRPFLGGEGASKARLLGWQGAVDGREGRVGDLAVFADLDALEDM